ncbi:MAG TPA: hypothetical protein VI916_02275 [Acidimicrobiia bacterium]|nr:hypothetical protein [Acidimicrobiia bacterium]
MADEPLGSTAIGDPGATAGRTLVDRLGVRGRLRAHPRFGVAIAAGGGAMALVGSVMIGGDRLAGDGLNAESPNTTPGVLISLAVLAAGYALVARGRRDGLRAGGAAAALLALPALLFFATFDLSDNPPVSIDVILMVSTIGWALAYLAGPSVGRPIFLGAALIGAWAFVLEQVEGLFSAPFFFLSPVPFLVGGYGASGFEGPDATTVGVVCLIFGYGYLVLAGWLDARTLHGFATPFVVAGLFIVNNGFSALSGDLEMAGTGILIAATGCAVAIYFSGFGRRATTWIGGAGVASGVVMVIGDAMEDSDLTAIGLTVLVVGAALIIGADLVSRAMSEPAEFDVPAASGDADPPD